MSHGPYKEYVVDGAEMSCSACGTHNDANPASLPASINGGFYIHRVDTKRVTIQSKRVCTDEDKKLICKAPLYCMITGTTCTPMLGEWINLRGRAANVKTKGYHFLLDDATIQCEKGGGTLVFINSGQTLKSSMPDRGFIRLPSLLRETGLAIRHPLAAWNIWDYRKGSSNITTICILFASNIGLGDSAEKEGTQINAFRHTLWQAIISNEYGIDVAEQVGNAHEDNPIMLKKIEAVAKGGLVVSSLLTLNEADKIIDLKNNIIGRKIGAKNIGLNNSELAKLLLVEFTEKGLFVAEQYNSTSFYKINSSKINTSVYEMAIERINSGLDYSNKERQNERG